MKNIGQAFVWGIKRLNKLPRNIVSFFIRLAIPVKKGIVLCWAYKFNQYSCNPRYLTEFLLENNEEYDIYWVFRKKVNTNDIDKHIKCVRFRSWRYQILVNTAEFLITNCRTDPYDIFWKKRPQQKYLMLWHGGAALKKIEKDAEAKLSYSYLRKARLDSKVCDLMISGCGAQSRLIRDSFWYDGEILEKGIPRNDIFFKKDRHSELRKSICRKYGIPEDNRLVLYAPTFRWNHSLTPYNIRWGEIIPELKKMMGGKEVSVLLRLHPYLLSKNTTPLLNSPAVTDVTKYHDMQELLCISDLLITDYSSSMFDFPMTGRPCLLYATDAAQYDRGYYFDYHTLPFPIAESHEELIRNIRDFNRTEYDDKVKIFLDEKIQYTEDGKASSSIAEWMKIHRL